MKDVWEESSKSFNLQSFSSTLSQIFITIFPNLNFMWPNIYVGGEGGGVASAKRKAQAQILDMLQTW